MRLRLPELLEARGWTPYRLSRETAGRISMTTAYRLAESGGAFEKVTAELLEELCDVFGVTPGELFERDPARVRAA